MTRLLIAVIVAAFVSACGPSAPEHAPADLRVAFVSGLGDVVADSQGRTLYRFDLDSASPPATNCAGPCATLWPPAAAGAAGPTTDGIDGGLAGVLVRPDGVRQLTLGGWPLYRYVNDTAPGQVNGQGVDGTWFVIAPSGVKVTGTPADGASGY